MAVHRWMRQRCGGVVVGTLPKASSTVVRTSLLPLPGSLAGQVWSWSGTEGMAPALTSSTYPRFTADWFAHNASPASGILRGKSYTLSPCLAPPLRTPKTKDLSDLFRACADSEDCQQ